MDLLLTDNIWLFYLGILIGPFIQEDAAVIGTASLSAAHVAPWYILFGVLAVGLVASDSWKYWIGHYARDHAWAQKFIKGKGTSKLKPQLTTHLGRTLMTVRFIPLTRVPAYIGAGLFGANIWIFEAFIVISGLLYMALTFILFHVLGQLLGEEIKKFFPLIGLSIAVIMIGWAWLRHKMQQDFGDTPSEDEPE